MSIGDHLVTPRFGYSHHGVHVAKDRVVHYSGFSKGPFTGPVQEVSWAEFANGRPVSVMAHGDRPFSRAEVARRARCRLGEDLYGLTSMNCEHFARWCVTGKHRSRQTDTGAVLASAGELAGAAAGATSLVASAGTVAGLSGPGIMSGLAAVGPGGAVGGAASLAGAAGFGAALLLNNTVLANHQALDKAERRARRIGRSATVGGAGATALGGVAVISSAGSVAGLSGAGIMSGLAAIGGTVGAGAAGGVAIVAAAPVAAAAALGLGLYALFR
jgi:hypothetical protein